MMIAMFVDCDDGILASERNDFRSCCGPSNCLPRETRTEPLSSDIIPQVNPFSYMRYTTFDQQHSVRVWLRGGEGGGSTCS